MTGTPDRRSPSGCLEMISFAYSAASGRSWMSSVSGVALARTRSAFSAYGDQNSSLRSMSGLPCMTSSISFSSYTEKSILSINIEVSLNDVCELFAGFSATAATAGDRGVPTYCESSCVGTSVNTCCQ